MLFRKPSIEEQLAMYSQLLQKPAKEKGRYRSPIPGHDDKHASLSLFPSRDGTSILWRDHALNESGDVYKLLMTCTGQSFGSILSGQRGLMPLAIKAKGEEYLKVVKANDLYTWHGKPWTKADLRPWGQYGVSLWGLEQYKAECIDWFEFKTSDGRIIRKTWRESPIVRFDVGDGFMRFYLINGKNGYKHFANTRSDTIFGLNCIPEKQKRIVLGAGQKDCVSGYSTSGIWHVSLNSENAPLLPVVYVALKKVTEEIVVIYDNDETGHKNMAVLASQWLLKCRTLPEEAEDLAHWQQLQIIAGIEGKERMTNYLKILDS